MTIAGANVLLVGAGGVGALYIHQLQRAGCTVTAVCRSNYNAVKESGFTLTSPRLGNVKYRPDSVLRSTADCPSNTFYDYVLVAMKSFPSGTPSLAEIIKPAVAGRLDTAIVLAQNGIGIEDEIAAAFPSNPILSGVVYLPVQQTSAGTIEHEEMLDILDLGTFPANAPASHRAAATRLADLMIKGGGESRVLDDIQEARWRKLLLNATWNPICALTLCSDGDFLCTSSPYARELVLGVMMEVVQLARAVGIQGVSEKTVEKQISIADRRSENGTGRVVSMLQDVKQGRPFEVEAILGNVVRIARKWDVKVPRLETLYALAKGRYEMLLRENQRACKN